MMSERSLRCQARDSVRRNSGWRAGTMRDRILSAAVSVMRERGVTGTTTKEIARVAGVAEGSIYNHFANKTELVAASMTEVAGGIRDALIRLSGRVGESTVEANLAELAEAEIAFFADLLPITGPVLGDHDLRDWLRRGGPHAGTGTSRRQDTGRPAPGEAGPGQAGQGGVPALGPVLGHVALIGYLEAERQAGRLGAEARPAYLAASLIGACQQYAFVRLLTPPETMAELAGLPPDPAEYAREVVHAILAGHLSDPTYSP